MAQSPIAVLIIVLATLTFEAILFGGPLVEGAAPKFSEEAAERDCGGFFGAAKCAAESVFNILGMIWGVIVFFFNLVTFNVPGAPLYVRVVLGGAISGALIWSLASLIRGN